MNWDALGAIAELLGAVGVILSVIYLAIQIRSNTSALKTNANWDTHHSFAEVNDYLAQGGEIGEIVRKSTDPEMTMDQFSDKEAFQFQMFARGMFQRLEAQYFQYKAGMLAPEVWSNRIAFNKGLLNLPVWKEFWIIEKGNSQFTEELLDQLAPDEDAAVVFLGQGKDRAPLNH